MMKDGYRHEYKYLISGAAARLLKSRLRSFMHPDPHVGETGQYTIRSLYFDDPFAAAYEEKMSGIKERTKYRIRYYNYDPSLLRLERKEKNGSLTRKTGQTISAADAKALTGGQIRELTGLSEELQRRCLLEGFRPRCLVDYDRTPFVCHDGNTRITLDENLRTRPFDTDLLASNQAMIPVLSPDQVILEVKFDDFLPGYLGDILADIPKAQMSISKYVLCMNLT
jgi:SPX domain protein involved in polyphosphate accumulation